MAKHTYKGQYFKLNDDSTEFVCDWCGCNEFHLRGKLIVNLCDGCETLHIVNNDKCNEVNREIMLAQLETRKRTYKNVIIHPPEYYEEKIKTVEYSQYLKEQETKKQNKTYKPNPIKLKH